MADIREAYDILSKNELLCHVFDFTEIGIPEFLDSGRKSWTLDFAQKWRKKNTANNISLYVLLQKQKIILIHFKLKFTLHVIWEPLKTSVFWYF